MPRNNRSKCPECGGLDTEQVLTDYMKDRIEETFICNECTIQYTNCYLLDYTEVNATDAN